MATSTGSDALDRMVERLGGTADPKRRYEYVLWLAKKLAPMPAEEQTDDIKVKGCVSQVFVRGALDEGVMRWQGDSDALITKGLLALLIQGLDGLTPEQVQAVDPAFIAATGLQTSLTPSRANGFLNILRAMQEQARKPEESPEGEQDTGEVDFNPLDEYEPMEMPPFVPPVMEELVQPESQAQNQIEAQDVEGDADKEGNKGDDTEAESMESADKVMQAQQVSEGQMEEDAAAQKGESDADMEESGRASDAEGEDEIDSAGGMTPEGAGPEVAQGEDEAEEDLGEQVFMYDEWDHRIEDYRPSWCTLRESRATREVPAFVAATFHEYGGVVTQIRRNFQLMRPERMRKMRYQSEGDDLDLDGLVEHVVDRKARLTPTDRVYIKRDKKDRDVTTAFLVDMSSSTDRKIDGRKRIIDIEKEGLILMCEALEAIRDEYAIYGFSGNGRDDAEFYTVKELGERYDDRVRSRIGGIYGRSKTRMGPAIRHATKRLMSVDSNVKLMILLTDGRPYDSDTYQDNAYAQADTQMALREARREKIHLFCVTVDQEGADYLPTMYSDANFVVIDDVRTLPQKLPQLYRRLTT